MYIPRITFAEQALNHMFHMHHHSLHSTEILAWRLSHLKRLTHICWLQSLSFSTHLHFQICVIWKWLWGKGGRGPCSNVIRKALVEILQERKKTCSTFLKCIWPREIPRSPLHRLREHTFRIIWLSFVTMLEPVQAPFNCLHNVYHTPAIAKLKMRGSGEGRAVSQAFPPLKCLQQLNLHPPLFS